MNSFRIPVLLLTFLILSRETLAESSSLNLDKRSDSRSKFVSDLLFSKCDDRQVTEDSYNRLSELNGIDQYIIEPILNSITQKAEQEDKDALLSLGESIHYSLQKGGYTEAMAYYLRSAKHGCAKAEFYIGAMYQQGLSVEEDWKSAYYWYNLSANKGSAISQYKLALLYLDGLGVEKNKIEATKWFQKAAVSGHKESLQYLAAMYEKSDTVEKDETKAKYKPKNRKS